MAKLRVTSTHIPLARLVAEAYRADGHEVAFDRSLERRSKATFRSGIDPELRRSLLETVAVFEPDDEESADLEIDAEIDLSCAAARDEMHWLEVQVLLDDAYDRGEVRALLESFEVARLEFTSAPRPLRSALRHGGTPSLVVRALRWLFGRAGFELEESLLPKLDPKVVQLELVRPLVAMQPPRQRFGVEIQCDDLFAGTALAARLRDAGFRVELPQFDGTDWRMQPRRRFAHEPGPLVVHELTEELSLIARETRAFLQERGVDLETFPFIDLSDPAHVPAWRHIELIDRIVLPLAAHAQGELRGYGGAPYARFRVTVRSDDAERSEPVLALMRELGFADPRHELIPNSPCGLRVSSRKLLDQERVLHSELCARVRALVAESVGREAPKPELRAPRDPEEVIVDISWRALSADDPEGELMRHRWIYSVSVFGQPGARRRLRKALEALGYTVDDSQPEPSSGFYRPGRVHFGAAPNAVAAEVAEACTKELGVRLDVDTSFVSDDLDVYVMLPPTFEVHEPIETAQLAQAPAAVPTVVPTVVPTEARPSAEPAAQRWSSIFTIDPVRALEVQRIDRPFVSSDGASVHVGTCVLERFAGATHPAAPSLDDFRHYCVDNQTAELLLYVARAISLAEPCLLEGRKGSAKTSAVLYLAAMLGQPVLRLDMHGHTGTGERGGRDISSERGALQWHDSQVVRAMREGHWLLLENIDKAEPQLVARLHSVLERRPSFVVAEHDEDRIASEAVHPRYRVVATTTPPGYACSSSLTPAIIDLFRAHRRVDAPSLLSVHAFLRFATEGEVPEVELECRRWPASRAPAPWPELSGFAVVRSFTDALASMHVAFNHALATSRPEPGGNAARYVPTRRTLISVLDLLAQRVRRGGAAALEPAMWEAIERYYVDRTQPSDRNTLFRQLDAHGLDVRMLALAPRAPAVVE